MLNSIIIEGRLVKDVELSTIGEKKVSKASFTLAVDMGKNSKGERITYFIPCESWNKLADTLKKYTKKGELIGVQGILKQSTYTNKDNKKVTSIVVDVDKISFIQLQQKTEKAKANEEELPF